MALYPSCQSACFPAAQTILKSPYDNSGGACYVFVLDCQMIFCFQPIWQKNLATLSVQSLLHIQKWVNEWPRIPRGAGINRLPLLFVLAFKWLCLDSHSSTVMQHRRFSFQVYFQHYLKCWKGYFQIFDNSNTVVYCLWCFLYRCGEKMKKEKAANRMKNKKINKEGKIWNGGENKNQYSRGTIQKTS